MSSREEQIPVFADFLHILRRSTDLLNEDPVREEFFSVERLEHYAAYLARRLEIRPNPKRGYSVLPKLKQYNRALLVSYRSLTEAVRAKQEVSPAAEWFVDNFHIVEDQLREIKQDLPKDYYDELPKLASGELKGYPRVYAVSLAIIAHTDSRLEGEMLRRFLKAFQQVAPLTIGELWAVAITLRIALVEHLTPLAQRIVGARKKRSEADSLADKLLVVASQPEIEDGEMVRLLSLEAGKAKDFDRAFVVQLTQRLRDQDHDVMPAIDWLEKQLELYHSTTTQQVIALEHHRQATAQVTVGNIISSMRLLSSLDWRDFVESVSLVDSVLKRDPANTYAKMDFATRDRYRHEIEKLAKRSTKGEIEVAETLVGLAQEFESTHLDKPDAKQTHVGFFLIGEGRGTLEKSLSYRVAPTIRLKRAVRRNATGFYLGTLLVLTVLSLVPVFAYFRGVGGSFLGAWGFCVFALIPASEFALSILNHNIAFFLKPKPLPKLDLEGGVPEEATTMVVVPTLFTSLAVVDELLENLLVHYLANQDANIYFALLGDFADADQENLPSDTELLRHARRGIEALNAEYATKGDPRFFLFHRGRKFNASEGKWLGHERKRGKLHEFNRLLRGAGDTSFLSPTADPVFLSKVQFVITLDSDTQLPRGAAHKLIATALHPLNRPEFDAAKRQVVRGYGILQPRISVSLVSSQRTRFARLFSGSTGLDPYTTACSDVYQDLFGEGSFTGKGLYVVDAFEAALENRVPENALLSHDLFESCYARSGLVSDVELFDDYPADYATYSKRQHRWVRGDWQIAQWLLPRVPTAGVAWAANDLSWISRWKIFDNLRRSLVPIFVFLWLICAWSVLPGSAWSWTAMVVILFVFPIYNSITDNIFNHRRGVSWRGHLSRTSTEASVLFEQVLLMFAFLAEQAWSQADAILRTAYRKLVSKRKLLEWVSFAQVQNVNMRRSTWTAFLGAGPVAGIAVAFWVGGTHFHALPIAAPFLLAWLANPFLKAVLKNPLRKRQRPLDESEVRAFRLYARRTWRFFETFLTTEGNWLAPDNFQEEPTPVVAHRTSPTNIGLQLLASVSAFDFGYLGRLELVESVERVFATLNKLDRLHGHFFNWYDTRTLEPLRPQYLSTVDSGNLAGHLFTLKRFFLDLLNHPPDYRAIRSGLEDTLCLLILETDRLEHVPLSSGVVSLKQFRALLDSLLVSILESRCATVEEATLFLRDLKPRSAEADDILNALAADYPHDAFGPVRVWFNAYSHQLNGLCHDVEVFSRSDSEAVRTYRAKVESLAAACEQIAMAMDFKFLFDEQKKIMAIGFNVTDSKRDLSYYDLLASESRLASFIAIAKGDVSQEHWFKLGRQMTHVKSGRALISWTATMFEYLMPLLVMRRYEDTLLDQTYRSVVARQIEYGKEKGVPWGISEAGYNARDLQLIYQYGPFGVPGLGLKRGLSDDLVVSPYSTMLASLVDPLAALSNLEVLEQKGALGRYGFYESIDYTPDRLQKKQKSFILRSFMAHHQGMSLVALDNLLHHNVMQERFHSEPLVQATELLLQERIPHHVSLTRPRAEEVDFPVHRHSVDWNPRFYSDAELPTPRTQLLSNGSYSVMVTTAGSGYSRFGTYAVSRWREDVTRDHWGHFFYIRNRSNDRVWSTCHQPYATHPRKYEVTLAEDKAEFWRQDGRTDTHTEIIVSPEDNAEIRRISLTNNSVEEREFEVTSFMEVVLASQADDAAHPAFSNLFVQTEFLSAENALLATRRRRSDHEAEIWGFHALSVEGTGVGSVQYETDRARFLGRGRNASNPFVISDNRPLSDTVGAVLDPIFSLRQTIRLAPGETGRFCFSTGVAHSREEALRLADKYHDNHIFTRETELAWTKSRVQLRHLNISSEEANAYQRLAGRVIFSDPSLRPRPPVLSSNTKTQSALWAYGISGDLPIVLARVSDEKDMKMVRQLLHAHEYLRMKGLQFDLVLLNEREASYLQMLQDELQRQIRMSGSQPLVDKPGGVFIRRADIMPREDVTLLKAVARVDLNSEKGTLEDQLKRLPFEETLPDSLTPSKIKRRHPEIQPAVPELEFFNGLGGFSKSGQNYVIVLKEGQWTPAPWINVVANDQDFGFFVSESGGGYTWSVNSRENRLTPWSNDAVSDPIGEAIYLRDEETGEFWNPTPLPIREKETYLIKHGQGYSQFDHCSRGIASELQVFVPVDASVKISYLWLKNLSDTRRKISVTSYVEWVLGVSRENSSSHIVTEHDTETGILLARNSYNNEFSHRVAFSFMNGEVDSFTCDRKAFIGRNRGPERPGAMGREKLSGRWGAGLDPCAAQQQKFELEPGEECEVILLLGQGADKEEIRKTVARFTAVSQVQQAFTAVTESWDRRLSTIEVKTPDAAMNTLLNRWLLYQTLSCRLWARTAFYQSGGAYGFRDQLQDVMALVYSEPKLAREHILRASARQFREGDVQHWWHPPTGRGVRTHFSDDLLWLPFVTSFYLKVTGDRSILEEFVPFIEAPLLTPEVESSYTQPTVVNEKATLLEHSARTIDRSLKTGAHGLPLMGCGDWNDGMNRVGQEGKGESVWVAWFLYSTIEEFVPWLSESESTRIQTYRAHQEALKKAIESQAWDGDWYRRAYFDNGTPLGSASNSECRIDSIAQSWAVLSGAGNPQRAVRAMAAVDEYLIHRGEGIVKLFTPPFDHSSADPGYIKGYVPGVRENGGQYTHAAIWTLMAFAQLGDGDRAGELYALLNPINHSSTRAGLHKYKVEPYVAAADIYGMWPHNGRGGWTWYTGSASWMYRAGLESILGFELRGDSLRICPRIPRHWREFEISYRHGSSLYHVHVTNRDGNDAASSLRVELDGVALSSDRVTLVDDGRNHSIKVFL